MLYQKMSEYVLNIHVVEYCILLKDGGYDKTNCDDKDWWNVELVYCELLNSHDVELE